MGREKEKDIEREIYIYLSEEEITGRFFKNGSLRDRESTDNDGRQSERKRGRPGFREREREGDGDDPTKEREGTRESDGLK